MTLDKSDNVYVTGSSESSTIKGDFGYQTIKLDAGGNEAWEANYEGPWRDNTAHGITVDGQGNTYVTGDSRSSATGDDFATVKYDSSGHQVWVARYNGPANGEDLALGIGLDAKGNIYVCGPSSRDSISGKRDYATVKYDTDGNQLWATRYSGPETTDDSYPTAFAVDTAGNSYVTGLNLVSHNGVLIGLEYYATVKYDTNGNQVWAARYKDPQNPFNEPHGIALDAHGNVFVTGITGPSPELQIP